MKEYTPTTDQVREEYAYYLNPVKLAEFDRWLTGIEYAAANKALLNLSGTLQAEAFENAVDVRSGKRKPMFVSVVRWLREEAEEYHQSRVK